VPACPLTAFLLRTHGVVEVSAVQPEAVSAAVGWLFGRLLLDVDLRLLRGGLRNIILATGLSILLCTGKYCQRKQKNNWTIYYSLPRFLPVDVGAFFDDFGVFAGVALS
jgi:hypothetical protein